MILLVPTSPEVPRFHRPNWVAGAILSLMLVFAYFASASTLVADQKYVEAHQDREDAGDFASETERLENLANRPLLKLGIAPKSWDLERALYSNFIHGGFLHLALNVIGAFAGARICTTFIPFVCTLCIFLLGGSAGLLLSIFAVDKTGSEFIPHVGASAGVFALMGTYYIYNFRFRTSYFFWFPGRHGKISLRTSWFFFLDVILMELVLTTAQMLPGRVSNVDHLAHVGGFFAGMSLALCLRYFQKWPSYLQTRGEFLYWSHFLGPKLQESRYDLVQGPYHAWLELLQINYFNDCLKLKLYSHLGRYPKKFTQEQLNQSMQFLNPTFTRLHSIDVADLVVSLIRAGRELPKPWLERLPYDSVIRLAKIIAEEPEDEKALLEFVLAYRKVHKRRPSMDRKLDILVSKLESLSTSREAG